MLRLEDGPVVSQVLLHKVSSLGSLLHISTGQIVLLENTTILFLKRVNRVHHLAVNVLPRLLNVLGASIIIYMKRLRTLVLQKLVPVQQESKIRTFLYAESAVNFVRCAVITSHVPLVFLIIVSQTRNVIPPGIVQKVLHTTVMDALNAQLVVPLAFLRLCVTIAWQDIF